MENIKNIEENIYYNTSSSKTCNYCGKKYTQPHTYKSHILFCEIIYNEKNQTTLEELNDIPEYSDLVKIVNQLAVNQSKLKDQLKEMQHKYHSLSQNTKTKTHSKKNYDWLLSTIKPNCHYNQWVQLSLTYLTLHNIQEIETKSLIDYICDHIFGSQPFVLPLFAFNDETHKLFIYTTESETEPDLEKGKWSKISEEILCKLLKEYTKHILKNLSNWYSSLPNKNNETNQKLYIHMVTKINSFDHNNKSNQNKFKKNIIHKLSNNNT